MAATRRNQDRCDAVRKWLKLNLGRDALAPLTGTDMRALAAAAHLIELYAVVSTDLEDTVLSAFHDAVMCMQPSTRELAYHAIAQVLEWDSRARVWSRAGLPQLQRVRTCAGERISDEPCPHGFGADVVCVKCQRGS